MALQSSGAISLNEIHIEAGGSSGTTASINDSDIRGLIDKSSGATMSFNEWYGASAFTARWVGAGGGRRRSMQYVDVATLSNASDFGDMHFHNNGESRQLCASCASITRGVYIGGNSSEARTTLEYITFDTLGDGTDFGDCGNNYGSAGISNDTRGVYAGNAYDYTEMEYITIASTGNTQDFGDLNDQGHTSAGSCASSTRGCFAGGYASNGRTERISYITTASTGNSTDFGDCAEDLNARANGSMGSNTRGLFCAGNHGSEDQTNAANGPRDTIEYITISSTGNATDFGDALSKRSHPACGSSKTRALPRCGGYNYESPGRSTTMDYITIASTGNASDFGDLVDGEMQWSGASNGCGGTSSTS